MKVETFRLYPDREDVRLTSYIIDNSPETLNGKKRPAVLICAGGAYLACGYREAEPVALKFASMGYHTFTLQYSTYWGDAFTGFDFSEPFPVKEHCRYPNPMLEVGMAMIFIHNHAKEWFVDTDKIALCGFSAGAHNTAMYATQWNNPVVQDAFPNDGGKLKPAALIQGYTLSDYSVLEKQIADFGPFAADVFKHCNLAYLGSAVLPEGMEKQVSPAQNVSADTPPTFLWSTSEDSLVPVQQSLLFATALADAKIPFEMHIFEKGDHGMALATPASAENKYNIDPDAAIWSDLAGKWLSKRFPLPHI